MSTGNLVDLTKKVAVVLEKRKIPSIKARVGFAIDISGSMQSLYNSGTMQDVVNRIQAIANRFDDNSELDMWLFNRNGYQIETATPDMFGTYVRQYILNRNYLWGGTSFAPVMHLVENFYFGGIKATVGGIAKGFLNVFAGKKEEAKEEPVYLIFLTDGDNDDETVTENLIIELQQRNIYIQFVGVGTDSSFRFVRRMADRYSNVGFVDFSQPSKVTDEQMYEQLLNDEFANWARKQ